MRDKLLGEPSDPGSRALPPKRAAAKPKRHRLAAVAAATADHFPNYARAEYVVDMCIHVAGVVLALIGIPILLVYGLDAPTGTAVVSLPLYSTGLLAMVSFSALYNLVTHPPAKELLRRFDHAAIFLMIAGTYGPFALSKVGGPWGIGVFVFVWCCAVLGTALAFLIPRRADRVTVILCVLMGWSILVAIKPLVAAISTGALALLIGGGVVYTVGIGFHLAERLPFHNAIWHGLVLVAAGCHYAAVLMSFA